MYKNKLKISFKILFSKKILSDNNYKAFNLIKVMIILNLFQKNLNKTFKTLTNKFSQFFKSFHRIFFIVQSKHYQVPLEYLTIINHVSSS